MAKDENLTFEEKKVKVRNYLKKFDSSSNIEKFSYYDISSSLNIDTNEIFSILYELVDEKVICEHVVEYNIFLLNTEKNEKRVKRLSKEEKMIYKIDDFVKFVSSLAITAVLFFSLSAFFADNINTLLEKLSPANIVFVSVYGFLIVLIIFFLLLRRVYYEVEDWLKRLRTRLQSVVFAFVVFLLLVGIVVSFFVRSLELFSVLLSLLLFTLTLFADKVKMLLKKIENNK